MDRMRVEQWTFFFYKMMLNVSDILSNRVQIFVFSPITEPIDLLWKDARPHENVDLECVSRRCL